MRALIVLFPFILFSSCLNEPDDINPYFAEIYPIVLEDINITCTQGESDNYIAAQIKSMEFCHYEDIVGAFDFSPVSKFSTASPNMSTSGSVIQARKGLVLTLGDENTHLNEHFVINFPDFESNFDVVDYLDSIFMLSNHDIMGMEDIQIPAGASNDEIILIESGSGYLNNFLIEINSKDSVTETGGIVFSISTIFGSQEGSFLRFSEVKKTFEVDGIYYNMIIEFQCDLYHWPQYGYEGLWGSVREGRIHAHVKLRGT